MGLAECAWHGAFIVRADVDYPRCPVCEREMRKIKIEKGAENDNKLTG